MLHANDPMFHVDITSIIISIVVLLINGKQ